MELLVWPTHLAGDLLWIFPRVLVIAVEYKLGLVSCQRDGFGEVDDPANVEEKWTISVCGRERVEVQTLDLRFE